MSITMKQLAESAAILAENAPEQEICSDSLYLYASFRKATPEQVERLKELGWVREERYMGAIYKVENGN